MTGNIIIENINNKMKEGYVYCFSNNSMPCILKIGMTERTPYIRLNEAICSDTWRPPDPYKLEIAKKVFDPKKKETRLHKLLTKYTERINPKREFFRVSLDEVKEFFDLMDGELLNIEKSKDAKASLLQSRVIVLQEFKVQELQEFNVLQELQEFKVQELPQVETTSKTKLGCRDTKKCFTDGQRILHKINNNEWIGIYNYNLDKIIHNGNSYSSLSKFSREHYKKEKPDRCPETNGWKECYCEVNGKWISTYNL